MGSFASLPPKTQLFGKTAACLHDNSLPRVDASPNVKLAKAPGRRIFSLLWNRRSVAADSSSCLNGQLHEEIITQTLVLGGEGVRADFEALRQR